MKALFDRRAWRGMPWLSQKKGNGAMRDETFRLSFQSFQYFNRMNTIFESWNMLYCFVHLHVAFHVIEIGRCPRIADALKHIWLSLKMVSYIYRQGFTIFVLWCSNYFLVWPDQWPRLQYWMLVFWASRRSVGAIFLTLFNAVWCFAVGCARLLQGQCFVKLIHVIRIQRMCNPQIQDNCKSCEVCIKLVEQKAWNKPKHCIYSFLTCSALWQNIAILQRH